MALKTLHMPCCYINCSDIKYHKNVFNKHNQLAKF